MEAFTIAITSSTLPSEIGLALLNLAEFMEHQDQQLRIPNAALAECAVHFNAYAKALHWKELDFHTSPTSLEMLRGLVQINTHLQQHDAAYGIINALTDQYNLAENIEWYERLGKWHHALDVYQRSADMSDEPNLDAALGQMRCHQALGDWHALLDVVGSVWERATTDEQAEIAPFAVSASWASHQWLSFEDYLNAMDQLSPQYAFFSAVLNVQRGSFKKAKSYIQRAREIIDTDLHGLLGDDYARHYGYVEF
jgi:FKBP12-rapamycin complex-associated protein